MNGTMNPTEMTPEQGELAQRIGNVFPSFSSELCQVLAQNGRTVRFDEGDVMMRTGQYFKSTMLLLSGSVKLQREGNDGGQHFLYYLEPGHACALSMVCATQRRASMIKSTADEDVEALAVPIELMDELIKEFADWYHFVLDSYRSRFEVTLELIDQIAFQSLDQRLIFYLNEQFEARQSDALHITHQDIATDLNTSREVISRLLKKMEREGMVALARNTVRRGAALPV